MSGCPPWFWRWFSVKIGWFDIASQSSKHQTFEFEIHPIQEIKPDYVEGNPAWRGLSALPRIINHRTSLLTIYVCPVLLMKSNQIEQRTSRFDGDMFFPPLLLMEELWNSCSWALPHPKWGGRGQLYLKTQSWFQKSLEIVHCLLASTTKIRLLNSPKSFK